MRITAVSLTDMRATCLVCIRKTKERVAYLGAIRLRNVRHLRPDLTILALHGSMNQVKRVPVYEVSEVANSTISVCTQFACHVRLPMECTLCETRDMYKGELFQCLMFYYKNLLHVR
jgi:hypothetical protein